MPTTYEALDKAYIKRGLRLLELEAERDQLRAELKAAKELVRWRKWPEEKPEIGTQVILILNDGYFDIGYLNELSVGRWAKDFTGYWLPIPPGPKE